MSELFVWVKALHVIAVIAWMAALLYLPRLFVYHADTQPGSDASEIFKVMERRLQRAIMTPAMIATFLFGIALIALIPGYLERPWMWAKLALVLVLAALHGAMTRWRRDFAADRNTRPAKFYRVVNEAPTVLMVLIVILVIVRPL